MLLLRSASLASVLVLVAAASFAAGCASEEETASTPPGTTAPSGTSSSSGGPTSTPATPAAAPGAVDPSCLASGYAGLTAEVTALFSGPEGAVVIAGTERVGIAPNGKLGAAGRSANSSSYTDLRPLPGGGLLTLDGTGITTWDAAGKALATVATSKLLVTPSSVLPTEGGYVVLGNEKAAAAQNKRVIAIQKLSTQGEPDTTFGDKGIARLESAEELTLEGVALGPDGAIWVHGSAKFAVPFVAKLSPTGATSIPATVLARMGTRASRDLVFAKDGGVFVLGMTGDAPQVAKLGADGTPDASFGDGGLAELRVTKPLSSKYDERVESRKLLLQDDGKLLVVSSYEWDDGKDRKLEEESLLVLRLGTDGKLDPTFGTGGQARVALGAPAKPSKAWAKPAAALLGSRLLVGGTTYTELGSKGTRAGGLVCLAL